MRGVATLPGYDRKQLTAGIAHIGIGAFHRAHQAVYVDSLLAKAPQWGSAGIARCRDNAAEPQWLA